MTLSVLFVMRELMFIVFLLNFTPYVMEYTTPRTVATILGFTTAINGLVRFTAVPLSGLLIDAFGRDYRLPLWGGYLGVIVCIIALLAMRPPEKVRGMLEG